MNSLPILKFAADYLDGTVYAPMMHMLVLLTAGAAAYAAVSKPLRQLYRLGERMIPPLWKVLCRGLSKLKLKGFGPEWDTVRRKIAPYIELVASLYFALVCLYSVVVIGLALWLERTHHAHASGWAIALAWTWLLVSCYAMRWYLEDASWHYHAIKTGRVR
ncbi:hypothetical protein ISF52_01145 [Burkholderia pseudomallei]|nr:hypothetical protein [Burkholderia pseudomallei]